MHPSELSIYLDNKQTLPKFFTKGFPGVPGVTGPVIPRNFDVKRTLLNSNIHRATVTGANLHIPILPLIIRSGSTSVGRFSKCSGRAHLG